MRIKHVPADFAVREQLNCQLNTRGEYAVYQVIKRGVTTSQVQARMAARLGTRRSAVSFPALKDRRSISHQHASVKGNPPDRIQGHGFEAVRFGGLDRPLRPTDITGNSFAITVRDMSSAEANQISSRLTEMEEHGLPNYFDEQRFGSRSPQDGFLAAHILKRDALAALRAYLSVPYNRDTAEVRKFKQVASTCWGDWAVLFDAAPQPSNFRSVLTYLRDHPEGYNKALNLIPRQMLSLYLEAYQSFLWNRIAGRYLETILCGNLARIEIAGVLLPVYRTLPAGTLSSLKLVQLSMPFHRAVYRDSELSAEVDKILKMEGFEINDLKARILQKAYLSRHERPLLLFPSETSTGEPTQDEHFPGRQKILLEFTLPRGSYATLVVRYAGLDLPCY